MHNKYFLNKNGSHDLFFWHLNSSPERVNYFCEAKHRDTHCDNTMYSIQYIALDVGSSIPNRIAEEKYM